MSLRFLYDNKVDDYTVTANSTATGYSVTNLQDSQLEKTYRTSGSSSEWVQIDAGSGNTFSANCVAVCEHNASTDGSWKIQAASNSSELGTTDGLLDESIDHSTGIMTDFFNATTARFWRLYIDDTGTTEEYSELGRLTICTYFAPTNENSFDWPYELIDSSVKHESIDGQVYGDKGRVHRLMTLNFSNVSDTERSDWEAMFEDVKTVEPFVFLYRSTQAAFKPQYMLLNKDLAFNHLIDYTTVHVWNLQVSLKEHF